MQFHGERPGSLSPFVFYRDDGSSAITKGKRKFAVEAFFKRYDRFAWRVDWLTKYIIVGVTAGLFLLIMAQVIFNYFLRSGLSWSEELAKLLLAWLAFVGAALATRRFLHIGLNAVVDLLPGRLQSIIKLAGYIVALAFLYALMVQGWQLAFFGQAQTSNYLNISYFWFYCGIPIGAMLNAIQVFYILFAEITILIHPDRRGIRPKDEEQLLTEV